MRHLARPTRYRALKRWPGPREGGERPGPAAPPSPVPEPEPTDHLPEELKVILLFSPLCKRFVSPGSVLTPIALLCCSRS